MVHVIIYTFDLILFRKTVYAKEIQYPNFRDLEGTAPKVITITSFPKTFNCVIECLVYFLRCIYSFESPSNDCQNFNHFLAAEKANI